MDDTAKALALELLSPLLDLVRRPILKGVSDFFLSAFKALGEKMGSFASSASYLTNFTKSPKVKIFLDFVRASWACRHHFTPEYEGSFLLLTRRRVSVELRSPIDCIVFMASSQRTRKSENSWIPLLSPSSSLGDMDGITKALV